MVKVVPNVRKKMPEPIIRENATPDSAVHSDAVQTYLSLAKAGLRHETVNRGTSEHVQGKRSVSSVGDFWSRITNAIRGT